MPGARRLLQQHLDLSIALALLLLAIIPILPVLLKPGQYAYSVDVGQIFTFERTTRAMVTQGTLFPLWNPYYSGGIPVLGTHGRPVLYPISLLLRVLPISASLNWGGILHVWLAALGIYMLAYDLIGKRSSSVVSAVAYMFSCLVTTRYMTAHLAMLYVLAWIGWLLFAYRRLLNRPHWINLLLTVLFTVLSVLPDHFMTLILVLPIPIGYFIYFAVTKVFHKQWRDITSGLALSVVVAVLSAGLTAVLTLPVLEWFPLTYRGSGVSERYASGNALEIPNLLTIAMPYVWYNPITGDRLYASLYWEASIYAGVLTAVLALFAIPIALRKIKTCPETLFYGILTFLSFPIMLRGSPLQQLAHQIIPSLRFFARFNLWWVIGVSILAGIGLKLIEDHLIAAPISARTKRFSVGVSVFALVASLIGAAIFYFASGSVTSALHARGLFTYVEASNISAVEIRNFLRLALMAGMALVLILLALRVKPTKVGLWSWLVAGTVAVDMLLFAIPIIPSTPETNFYDPQNPMYRLQVSPSEVRLATGKMQSPAYLIPTTWYRTNGAEISYANNVYQLGLKGSGRGAQLFSAAYFVTQKPYTGDDAVEVQHAGTDAYLYMYKDNWPRIYAAPRAEALSEEATLARISQPDFDPTNTVLVISDDPPEMPTPSVDTFDFAAKWTAYTPNHIAARITANETAMVVFSETYYPGWKPRIDGQPTRLYRANYAFRGVIVPPGEHLIEMDYQPASVRIGLIISAVSLVALIIICAWMASRERSNS